MPEQGSDNTIDSDRVPWADDIFDALARQFPVCMSSDEFHFFPQARAEGIDRSRWDDFSASALEGTIDRLTRWEGRLIPCTVSQTPAITSAQSMDADMLLRIVRTLRGQFAHVRAHETQPTFYLTIVGIGLSEAFEDGPAALQARLEHLPAFIDQAIHNLKRIPRLFRELGIDMLAKQQHWLSSLHLPERHRAPIQHAYQRLANHLRQAPVGEAFRLPVDLYAEIAHDHMGCRLPLNEISRELELEIAETRAILKRSAADIAPGGAWQAVVNDLPRPPTPPGGPGEHYHNTISQLAAHCTAMGLITPDLVLQCPVHVKEIPAYMRPVRSNAAYSMPPGHPPRGGTFFIQSADRASQLPADYRLLTAHETYPGHHLLDTCRWRHQRPVRRQIEFPIFYEGWASFSEELLFDTGFFSGPSDDLLMAKRRFWRALRGQIDVDIHMRRRGLDETAARLTEEGMPLKQAQTMVRRYSLKPGYQLAYTLGRRRFRQLYDACRRQSLEPIAFARRVLAQGQIRFHHLEQVLRQGG